MSVLPRSIANRRRTAVRRAACLPLAALLLGLTLGGTAAASATLPGLERPVKIAAREQPVGRFLEELLGHASLPVRVDPDIRGTVNGDFDGSAGEIFEDIAASFQLTTYYDGAVAWVYPASDTMRDLVYVPGGSGQRVVDTATRLGIVDANNRVSVSNVGVVATGTERFVEQVREIADAVQRDTKNYSPADVMRVFKLKYAWAGDVTLVAGGQEVLVPGVASLLRNLVEPGSLGVAGPHRVQRPRSRSGLRGQGLSAVGASEVQDDRSPSTTAPLPPAAGSTRDTRIVADTLNNAVVIRDRSDRMASYEALIASLDIEPEMIELEATIIDLNTSRLRELGINWRVQGEDAEALFGDGTLGDTRLGSDVDVGDITPAGQGGIVSLVLGDSTKFISRIRALETQGAARVVSKPHVMTLSNVEALLDTSSTFFVRVEGDEEVDLFDVSVGTTLRVTPHVFDGRDGARIKLRVNIEDGSTTAREVDSIPIIERSTINTQALINEGESLLIGGLVREFDEDTISKVPGLGDVPVLGALFRNSGKSTRRVERMFLITPRVNLRAAAGKRYSAPVLSGTESDILESGPSRIEPALAGLASRDSAFPLARPLPRGNGGDVGLTARGQPMPVDPSSRVQTLDIERRSLRERLRARPPASRRIEAEVPPAERARPVGGEWQAVGAPRERAAGAARTAAREPRGSGAAVETDADGWQAIVR